MLRSASEYYRTLTVSTEPEPDLKSCPKVPTVATNRQIFAARTRALGTSLPEALQTVGVPLNIASISILTLTSRKFQEFCSRPFENEFLVLVRVVVARTPVCSVSYLRDSMPARCFCHRRWPESTRTSPMPHTPYEYYSVRVRVRKVGIIRAGRRLLAMPARWQHHGRWRRRPSQCQTEYGVESMHVPR